MKTLRSRAPLLARATLAAAISLLPVTANADPPYQPHVDVRSTTLANAWQLRSLSGRTVTIRRFVERLDLAYHAPATPWQGEVSLSWAFDQGLAAAPTLPAQAESQLEPGLHLACVRGRPFGAIDARVGRCALLSPAGVELIDGLSLRGETGLGASLHVALGLRPESAVWRLNDPAWDAWGDRTSRDSFVRTGLLSEVGGGIGLRLVRAELGARRESSLDGDFRYDERVWASAELGPVAGPRARFGARYSPLLDRAERAELRLALPAGRRISLDAAWVLRNPVFPLDSIFAVFASDPRTEWSVRARRDGAEWVELALLASETVGHGEAWWPEPDSEFGVEAGIGGDDLAGRTAHFVRLFGVASPDVRRGTVTAGVALRLDRRGTAIDASSVLAHATDDRSVVRESATGAYSTLALRFRATPWADGRVVLTAGTDSRDGLLSRATAMFDIRLPGNGER